MIKKQIQKLKSFIYFFIYLKNAGDATLNAGFSV
jgi:hypothetical protein